jgi:hypothetical protein
MDSVSFCRFHFDISDGHRFDPGHVHQSSQQLKPIFCFSSYSTVARIVTSNIFPVFNMLVFADVQVWRPIDFSAILPTN